MKNTPLVSVIVATYNQEKFIGRCLRSLLLQSMALEKYEIIVINDSSNDRTPFALELFHGGCEKGFRSIRIIHNNKNIGLAASLNKAIRVAHSPYIVRVDSDDYVNKYFLKFLTEYLLQNPEIDAVIRGDESSFHQLLNNIDDDWNNIQGICYLDASDNYHDFGAAQYTGELDELPSLYEKGYFKADKPFYQLETSRGCNGSCSFCTSAISQSVRYFSLERIESDLTVLKNAGVKEIRIVDRTFNADKKRAVAMLEMFRDTFTEMCFHSVKA